MKHASPKKRYSKKQSGLVGYNLMSDEVFRGQHDAGKLVLVGKGRDEIIELFRLVGLRVNELRSGDNNQAGSDSGQAQSVHSEFTFRIQTDDRSEKNTSELQSLAYLV